MGAAESLLVPPNTGAIPSGDRPPAPSLFGGPVAQGLSLVRCTACEKPLLEERPDGAGRCTSCSARDARRVHCGCGFLYSGEACDHAATAQDLLVARRKFVQKLRTETDSAARGTLEAAI